MKIDKSEKYIILGDEEEGVKEFASFLEYIIPKGYADNNLVIDLLKYTNFGLTELLYFLKISNKQRAKAKSFVIVNNAINPDVVPEEIIVTPTISEAADIIEFEEITRDLGF